MNPQPVSLADDLRKLAERLRKNGNATRYIDRGSDVPLVASLAQMKEIHAKWNLVASKCVNDSNLWPCVEAIADILFREAPPASKYGEVTPAGASLITCADELSALLAQHAVAEPQPWLYAIQETNAEGVASWHDGEQCVFGDRESAQDEVDRLNDPFPDGENPFQIVPLYRAAAHAAEQPKENWQPVRGQYVWVEGKLTENQPETFPKKLRIYVHGVGTGIAENVRPVTEMAAEQPKLTEEQVALTVIQSKCPADYMASEQAMRTVSARLMISAIAAAFLLAALIVIALQELLQYAPNFRW